MKEKIFGLDCYTVCVFFKVRPREYRAILCFCVFRSNMSPVQTRYVHVNKPNIFLANGYKVHEWDLPSATSLSYFLNKFVATVYLSQNNPRNHRCTSLCGQPFRLSVGFPYSENLKDACPEEIHELIDDFEQLLSAFYASEAREDVEIQSVVLIFFPCAKVLEIHDAAIYLG